MAQTTYLQTEILLKDIVNYQNSMETFSLMLKDSEEKYSTTLSEVLSTVRDHQNEMRKRLNERSSNNSTGNCSNVSANHPNQQPEVTTNGVGKTLQHQQQQQNHQQQQQRSMANGESKQVRKALRSILVMQDEVWGILHENTKLIEQFTHLAVTSSASSLDENSQQILADLEAAVLTNNY